MRYIRFRMLAATTTLLGATACNFDAMNGAGGRDLAFGSAFNTLPAGMEMTASSYSGDGSGLPWGGPEFGRGMMMGMGGPGMRGGPGMGGMMGGGLGADFVGAGQPGSGPHRGAFAARIDSSCTIAGTDVTCAATRSGLTVTTIYTITSVTGAAQTKIDTLTTNTVRSRTTATGTVSRSRDGSVTATVNNSSDRTVTGLAPSSTQRTVNGWAKGSETASGTNREGQKFTAVRTSTDTTTGLVVPVSSGTSPSYPTAGRVVRVMSVQTTIDGGTPTTNNRREVITYDGSATAKVIITENGTTKNCTIALPRGRPSCG
ncbi:MAG: hypothetical protein ACK6DP_03595 [Gemmatimonas sp.]|uniref:hypothetical protein n=1 Tax=Gemmatimonas sp. TaxID=1962908 RepID=UPI00391EEB59|nr:hypothetical protein [Gemmatimonadota bacterium]